MYFQIENTPEHVRRARRKVVVQDSPKEEIPRLLLAPFSRPPQVVFENIPIGTPSERCLEVFNSSKQIQQITLGKVLPEGLTVCLPNEWLVLRPEECYTISLVWTPNKPTALRETIRFTNENRGRYDVIIVLKSAVNIKGKNNVKGLKISPGKIKKKPPKRASPVMVYKKKTQVIYGNSNRQTINLTQSKYQYEILRSPNKENVPNFDYSVDTYPDKNPFDSSAISFNTSEIFSNIKRSNVQPNLEKTYEKSFEPSKKSAPLPQNVLKPFNKKHNDTTATDIFDNLSFTPLKGIASKTDKLDKGPKIVMSLQSDSEFDDSLDLQESNKENETHSICITSSQPPNKWLTVNHQQNLVEFKEMESLQNKKIPNTSSPKELSSPNFSINTEFSRISDLSFFPPRCSTEKKTLPKLNNDTHDLIEDLNFVKLSSDTFTKESPNERANQPYVEPRPFYVMQDQNARMCRQSLFREYQLQREYEKQHSINTYAREDVWSNAIRNDVKSPPRSITPPLTSIPEESTNFSETQILDKTGRDTQNTFTIDRTFDKVQEGTSFSTRESWSKKSAKAETNIWKVPIAHVKKTVKSNKRKDSMTGRLSTTYETNEAVNQSASFSLAGTVYSQSMTVDPFLSATYFYDQAAVEKFESEFKRWLNCILTPPADLDSNIEQKIDVGKAWIENRNKEVPAAPTKEQVCIAYHNSHRLDSLRRSARALLSSPEISLVLTKLYVQIDKKLISIRTDRNLHLDVGLQKTIMELLLSYNPLWLRIGLEAIYAIVLPLKSNSDIEGLTTFIIHRMFKNPFLKNKTNAPNMLRPAYMEAIKKFTLKKFFTLVFFLDQAKQRRLISHDPCLFCRNAVCKESREIVIKFTRELIAGIGDITKHLRPLGYVVCHKQSYLDEYKYAVHNIALDIRDGVRLTKVMEIIMMKNGLLSQLRTPAISRLQKIHNVQVALNALKEANFVIEGDITANDIADGHREKTLSLLWQIIHVYRAPLFEKAAVVIQIWWRKKYEVILEKRREEELLKQKLNNAASVIQYWWRRIQYNRLVEWKMQQVVTATVTIQTYCRRWLCRSRLLKMKNSVLKIEEWYSGVKKMQQAKKVLQYLKLERQKLREQSAIVIQSPIRSWICRKRYLKTLKKVVLIQSIIRCFLVRTWYMRLTESVKYIQQKYRSKLQMRIQMRKLAELRRSAVVIQSQLRMINQYRKFRNLKNAVRCIEQKYIALVEMRKQRQSYLQLKQTVILIQSLARAHLARKEYTRQRHLIVTLQRKVKALQTMKQQRASYLKIKTATLVLQIKIRAYLQMKKCRKSYLELKQSAICIQRHYRARLLAKRDRDQYLKYRNAVILIQNRYRDLIKMRQQERSYHELKNAALVVQRRFRAIVTGRNVRKEYHTIHKSIINVQQRYTALLKMRELRSKYLKLKTTCIKLQTNYRSKKQRQIYMKQKEACTKIQRWFRCLKQGKEIKTQFEETKKACTTIQKYYKAYIFGRKQRTEYLKIRKSVTCIQTYYRSYVTMKTVRNQYIQLKTATVTIQKFYRSYLETKKQRTQYLQIRSAVTTIQNFYRCYKLTKNYRENYCRLRNAVLNIQNRFRSRCVMKNVRADYLRLRSSARTVQTRYRALIEMRKNRQFYQKLRLSVVTIQKRYRANCLMKKERIEYLKIRNACIAIQRFYRGYSTGKKQRQEYLQLWKSALVFQTRYRALIEMRKERYSYLKLQIATLLIQRKYRAYVSMKEQKTKYIITRNACITLQRGYRAYITGKPIRSEYLKTKNVIRNIQKRFRAVKEMRRVRNHYIKLKEATTLIQTWYRGIVKRRQCQNEFMKTKKNIVTIQSFWKMYRERKRFLTLRQASVTIQRYYRSYKLTTESRTLYLKIRADIIKVQSYVRSYIHRKKYVKLRNAVLVLQSTFRLKRDREISRKLRESAAICIQKTFRRYLSQSRYKRLRQYTIFVQRAWRGKLLIRLMRCEFLQKKRAIIKLQAIARGYLMRQRFAVKKEELRKQKEETKKHWAASKIQALFRGNAARGRSPADGRVRALRRRWRQGALRSTQESMRARNREAILIISGANEISHVITAFRSLELLTEIFPMLYDDNASMVVERVYLYMSFTNRSISSVEVLKSGAAVLVNLTRYKVTGPKIYERERIMPILKFMWRFSTSETQLFCIFCTYLWLFAKYAAVRKDLAEYLQIQENRKLLVTIKSNVDRMRRMAGNSLKSKFHTPQTNKFLSRTSMNHTLTGLSEADILQPALEPDYGIVRAGRPRYFEDPQQAINCLFHTYKLYD